HRSQMRGNPLTLWCGGLFGLSGADLAGRARATVDRRVYGFRPLLGTAAPVMPLVIELATWSGLNNQNGKQQNENQNQTISTNADRFTVDLTRGLITEGSDGIAEIDLRANLFGAASAAAQGTSRGSLCELMLAGGVANDATRQRRVMVGLNE